MPDKKRMTVTEIMKLTKVNTSDSYVKVDRNAASRTARQYDGGVAGDSPRFIAPVTFTLDDAHNALVGVKVDKSGKSTCKICGQPALGYVVCEECREKYKSKILDGYTKALREDKETFNFEL